MNELQASAPCLWPWRTGNRRRLPMEYRRMMARVSGRRVKDIYIYCNLSPDEWMLGLIYRSRRALSNMIELYINNVLYQPRHECWLTLKGSINICAVLLCTRRSGVIILSYRTNWSQVPAIAILRTQVHLSDRRSGLRQLRGLYA